MGTDGGFCDPGSDVAQQAPYGTWRSPISAEMIARGGVRISAVAFDGKVPCWLEGRPAEGGRNVLVRDGVDVTPAPYDVRTRAHEYGGGAFLIDGGRVCFTNDSDQRIYHYSPGTDPVALTAAGPYRFADMILDAKRNRLISIRENHQDDGEPINELVGISLEDGSAYVLASGHDFYSTPTLSPEGNRLAWLTWNHPNMPWDETELWFADVGADGSVESPHWIAGGSGTSVFQPSWSPEGELWFVADPDGWWNLHRWTEGRITCPLRMEAEFGMPQWVFRMRTYGFAGGGTLVCTWTKDGVWHAGQFQPDSGTLDTLPLELTDIHDVAVSGSRRLFLGGSPQQPTSVVLYDLSTGSSEVLRSSTSIEVDAGFLSEPEPIDFPTSDGVTAHAFHYPPRNADHSAPDGERPPLIVVAHGGPTASTGATLDLRLQYWTSRGFAVLDVNYRGSTGYGRAYRELLKGQWGIADVEDCVNGARYLADRGLADAGRLAIRGSSAGGYLVLAALTFHDVFQTGASYYGVSDLEALAKDTHKFESRYLDLLVGPYPESAVVYRARSPIHYTDQLDCPVIFFQGLEDKVVPPAQAEQMVEVLRSKDIPVEYLSFEGEQHGFRRAETIRQTLEAELAFYGRVFGFTPAA